VTRGCVECVFWVVFPCEAAGGRMAVFRSTLPEAERLSVSNLVCDLRLHGQAAREAPSVDDIVATIARERRPGDLVVIMSNGGFGGIHQKLLRALA